MTNVYEVAARIPIQTYCLPVEEEASPRANALHVLHLHSGRPSAAAAAKEAQVSRQEKKGRATGKRRRPKIHSPPRTISAYDCELAIGKKLGSGGYSKCYLARSASGKEFAAKFIARDTTTKDGLRVLESIKREMQIHHPLAHANIVRLWQLIECEKHIALVLDYCPNSTLQDLIDRRGAMFEPAACEAMGYILDAVAYLHENFIHHGDLKLSNILLDAEMRPMLADFGFAKQFPTATYTRRHLCGTPSYMAPEILKEPCEFGLPSDVWALGIIAYHLLYGRSAFESKTVEIVYSRIKSYDLQFPELSPPISGGMLLFMLAMLHPEPSKRPTVHELVQRFEVDAAGYFCGDTSSLTKCVEPLGVVDTELSEKRQACAVVHSCMPSDPLDKRQGAFRRAWSDFWDRRLRVGRSKHALPAAS